MNPKAQGLLKQYLQEIGADEHADPELVGTPQRVTELLSEWFVSGRPAAQLSRMPCEGAKNEIVMITDLTLHSLCVHHMTPFFGQIHVAYTPRDWICGFGGIDRLVKSIARRPQLLERLVENVSSEIFTQLDCHGVAVGASVRQMCMELTGSPAECRTIAVSGHGTFAGRATELLTPFLYRR